MNMRNRAFVSYSHADAKYLTRLQVHLAPYIREKKVDMWDDTRITLGAQWKEEIKQAMALAKVAILLISADFMASEFIAQNELPPLLEAAEQQGMLVVSVILSPCAFEWSKLACYQSLNAPSSPLINMSRGEQEAIWAKLAKHITDALTPALLNSMPSQIDPQPEPNSDATEEVKGQSSPKTERPLLHQQDSGEPTTFVSLPAERIHTSPRLIVRPDTKAPVQLAIRSRLQRFVLIGLAGLVILALASGMIWLIRPRAAPRPASTPAGSSTHSGNLTNFTIPTSESWPFWITAGPDGALWFTENVANKIGRISTSGSITEFANLSLGSEPKGITAGPDGALWFTESAANRIGRITTSGDLAEFVIPTSGGHVDQPEGITAGPDGALWFTEHAANKIGRISTSGSITEFVIPTSKGQPEGITAGPNGTLWFTETLANKIGRISTSGSITEFAIPTSDYLPLWITAGSDGALWFTELAGNTIGRISTGGSITEFAIPTYGSGLEGITAGPNSTLWFTESTANRIGRISTSGSITEFAIPTFKGKGEPEGITVGPDGALWFTEYAANKIGRISTSGK